jgi:hypothetical protein
MNAKIAEVEQALQQIEEQYDRLADLLPSCEREAYRKRKEEAIERRRQREELVKRCHPDGSHWPPHPECPACQKLMGMLENQARVILGEDAKDEKKLEEKFWELFEKKYVKKPTEAVQEGRAEDATGGQGGRADGDSGDVGVSHRESPQSDTIPPPRDGG